jgi:DNA-binding GntR family transcriptional regulator
MGGAVPPTAMPTAERPPSLAEHVRLVLREDILSGRFEPGTHLTEALVMERTGVSRTPAREGMRLLHVEGIVVFERGRGTYVAHQLSRDEASVIYGIRLVLEPELTRLAAERMTSTKLAKIEAVLQRFQAALDAGASGTELGQLDADFHHEIYLVSGSDLISIFRSYWSKLQFQLSVRIYKTETPSHFVDEHRAILRALAARDGEAASTAMAKHIAHGEKTLTESFAPKEERRGSQQ